MTCSNATAGQRNQNGTVKSRYIHLSSTQPVIQSASRCMADRTGQGFTQGRTTRSTSPAAAHQGLGYRLVQPVDSPMATDRPHWVPCDRLRRSWEGQPGQGAPERRDPSQPRRDVWGTLDRLASPISLTLSHLAPTRGLVRNGGAVPAFQVGMSEGVKV